MIVVAVIFIVVMMVVKATLATEQGLEEISMAVATRVAAMAMAMAASVIFVVVIAPAAVMTAVPVPAMTMTAVAVVVIRVAAVVFVFLFIRRNVFFQTGEFVMGLATRTRGDGGLDDNVFRVDIGIVGRNLIASDGQIVFKG